MLVSTFVKIVLFMSRALSLRLLLICFVVVLLNSTLVHALMNEQSATEAQIQFNLLTPQFETSPGKVELIKIKIDLPDGFHAYKDQFKIQDLNPTNFKSGQLRINPEVEFFDKFSNKQKLGMESHGEIEFQIESPEVNNKNSDVLEFDLRYQVCSEKVCYLPKTKNFKIDFHFDRKPAAVISPEIISKTETIEVNTKSNNFLNIEFDPQRNLALTLFFIFLAGILTSFTPCIFPMIPITLSILGHNAQNNSRSKNLSRSIMYVLGIATTYAILGVAAALTGSLFGKFLAHPAVVWSMAALFVVMALSMWGLFEIQAPAVVRNKFQSGQVKGFSGIFLMGLVAGIVASPCVGPVLVSILSFVSTTQNAVLGFIYLFTYAVGLGLIFIVIGLFSEALKILPRSGTWMETIKFILGLIMIFTALYYIQFIVEKQTIYALTAISFTLISLWKIRENFIHKKVIGIGFFSALMALSALAATVALLKPELLIQSKVHSLTPLPDGFSNTAKPFEVLWTPYSEDALNAALGAGKPIIIDFWADWCGACHELKEKTFSKYDFQELSKNFTLLVVDATEDTPENQKILTKYGVQGLPTVYFMNSNGEPLKDLTFNQFIEWPELKVKMDRALDQLKK
jgi:thioredoxin:protein disulfide reductase